MSGGIEPLFQPPARLQLMAALAACDEAEFATLRDILDVSDSVLSKHLAALSEADLVALKKAKQDGRQRTWIRSTARGRKVFNAHLAALRAMVDTVQQAIATE